MIPLCAALVLTACSGSKPSAEPNFAGQVVLEPVPDALKSCPGPAEIDWSALQNNVMPPRAMLSGWARDRRNLVICVDRVRMWNSYYEDLRSGFGNAETKD